MEIPEEHRAQLIAEHGYVPGDLLSMAEGVVAAVEARTGVRLEPRPGPAQEAEPTDWRTAASRHLRTWELKQGDWEVTLQYTGFDIYAFTENLATEEKDMTHHGGGFAHVVEFVSAAVERVQAETPAPGPR